MMASSVSILGPSQGAMRRVTASAPGQRAHNFIAITGFIRNGGFLDGFFAAHPPTAGEKVERELEVQVRRCLLGAGVLFSVVRGCLLGAGACLKWSGVQWSGGACLVQVLVSNGQGCSLDAGTGFYGLLFRMPAGCGPRIS